MSFSKEEILSHKYKTQIFTPTFFYKSYLPLKDSLRIFKKNVKNVSVEEEVNNLVNRINSHHNQVSDFSLDKVSIFMNSYYEQRKKYFIIRYDYKEDYFL